MSDRKPRSDLRMSPEEMRSFGYRVVDLIVDRAAELDTSDPTRRATRADMERRFREPPPEKPSDPEAVLHRVERDVFAHAMCLDHPRFFGWVPGPTNFVSVMAEALAASVNPFMGSWLVSAAPSTVELVTVDWLREIVGLPDSSGGLFVSGGSMANLTALAVARETKLGGDMSRAVVYGSDETHSSLERALRVLGFRDDPLRTLPSDDAFRIEPDALAERIRVDRASGLRPFCVVANAGTTNTGAVDPVEGLADVCRREDLWLHVDGAYGVPAMLDRATRARFAGIELADSVTLDPHKWLFQPYEIGCVLVRDRALLPRTFAIFREYMRDATGPDEEVNFRDYGVQLTRSFRALKLWMSIQVFGLEAFRRAVRRGIELAEHAETLLDERPGWEVVSPARIGLICFRYVPGSVRDDPAAQDRLTAEMTARMYDDGYAVVSSTRLHGRPVLRLCTINPRATRESVVETLDRFERFADEATRAS